MSIMHHKTNVTLNKEMEINFTELNTDYKSARAGGFVKYDQKVEVVVFILLYKIIHCTQQQNPNHSIFILFYTPSALHRAGYTKSRWQPPDVKNVLCCLWLF